MTTSGLCKRIRQGRAHDLVSQQIQYAGDDLLQSSRDVRQPGGEFLTKFLDELGQAEKVQSPRRPSKPSRTSTRREHDVINL
jgi:hypothetical protein